MITATKTFFSAIYVRYDVTSFFGCRVLLTLKWSGDRCNVECRLSRSLVEAIIYALTEECQSHGIHRAVIS